MRHGALSSRVIAGGVNAVCEVALPHPQFPQALKQNLHRDGVR